MNKVGIIILAAGKGTRMRSNKPKVMQPLAGKSMISRILQTVSKLSVENISLVIADGDESVRQEALAQNPNIEFIIQKERLGTAHAVKCAMEHLTDFTGDILILYGDTPLLEASTMQNMLSKLAEGFAVNILGFHPKHPAEYGRLIVDENDELKAIIEFKEASEAERAIKLCNSGVVAIKADILRSLITKVKNDNAKGEYYLTDIVAIAKSDGMKCSYIQTDEEEVMGINSQKELAMANKLLQEKLRLQALENGVNLVAPETVFLADDTKFGQDVIIEPNVFIGSGVEIGDNVTIRSFSYIEGTKIANDVIIGPFARLRQGTSLEKGARIGNFVEVKNSQIGEGSKVNHLSYIGDSELASDVNIGAGTITCNYDGFAKHKTKIEEGVFIGSNTALVAPVTIGQGAIIAAGSTITKNVPNGSISLTRGEQRNLENKAKYFREKNRK
jgi:bifunctional UDP-N-acetylglucosamine pyrophosphorylase/glucosamine-1-phosphate N-acetyltransferase